MRGFGFVSASRGPSFSFSLTSSLSVPCFISPSLVDCVLRDRSLWVSEALDEEVPTDHRVVLKHHMRSSWMHIRGSSCGEFYSTATRTLLRKTDCSSCKARTYTEQTVLTLQPFKSSVRVTRCMCAKCVDAQAFMACILSYKSCLY